MKRVGLVATHYDRPDLVPIGEVWVSESVPPEQREALAREAVAEIHRRHHGAKSGSLLTLASAIPDPEHVEDPKVQSVLTRALQGFGRLANRIRVDLLAAIKRDRRPEAARRVLARHMPALTQAMTDTQLAASLAGMQGVAKRIPQAVLEAAKAARPSPLTGGPLQPPWEAPGAPGGEEPIQYPIIDEAVKDLQDRALLTRGEYDLLADNARREAFTVAGLETHAIIGNVRDALVDVAEKGETLDDFAEKFEPGTFLSPGHREVVFRNGIQSAYAAGLDKVVANPVVNELFPYMAHFAIHDDRVRHDHKAIETLGLDGTNVYRADDPVSKIFAGPWSYNCVPAGAEIITSRGPVPISEVNRGDAVLTHVGRWRHVGGLHVSKGPAEIVALDLDDGAGLVRLTAEHRVLTQRGWIEAASLNIEDKLYQPVYAPTSNVVIAEVNYGAKPEGLSNDDVAIPIGLNAPLQFDTDQGRGQEKIEPERVCLAVKKECHIPGLQRFRKRPFMTTHANNSIDVLCRIVPDGVLSRGDHSRSHVGTTGGSNFTVRFGNFVRALWVTGIVQLERLRACFQGNISRLENPTNGPEKNAAFLANVLESCPAGNVVSDSSFDASRPHGELGFSGRSELSGSFGVFRHSGNCTFKEVGIKTIRKIPWGRRPVYNLSVQEDESYICQGVVMHNCRCGRNPMTVRQAAAKGVREAITWLASEIPPAHPEHVPMPPFSPPPGWTRNTGTMLSLALSGAWDESQVERDEAGRFASQGGSSKGGESETIRPTKGRKGASWGSKHETISATDLFKKIHAAGGFTYSPHNENSPKSGFAVAAFSGHEKVYHAADLSVNDVAEYLDARAGTFASNDRACVGAWVDDEMGKIYLDVSMVVDTEEEATALAHEYKQEGIYDLAGGKTIVTKEQGERRLATGTSDEEGHWVTIGAQAGGTKTKGKKGKSESEPSKHGEREREAQTEERRQEMIRLQFPRGATAEEIHAAILAAANGGDDAPPSLFKSGANLATKASDKEGHWVTIGAQAKEKGSGSSSTSSGKHGGTPVFIKGGKIEKGPAALVGHKPDEIPKEPEAKPDEQREIDRRQKEEDEADNAARRKSDEEAANREEERREDEADKGTKKKKEESTSTPVDNTSPSGDNKESEAHKAPTQETKVETATKKTKTDASGKQYEVNEELPTLTVPGGKVSVSLVQASQAHGTGGPRSFAVHVEQKKDNGDIVKRVYDAKSEDEAKAKLDDFRKQFAGKVAAGTAKWESASGDNKESEAHKAPTQETKVETQPQTTQAHVGQTAANYTGKGAPPPKVRANLLIIQGNTKPIRELLKARGWKWNPEKGYWKQELVPAHMDMVKQQTAGADQHQFISGLNAKKKGCQVSLGGEIVWQSGTYGDTGAAEKPSGGHERPGAEFDKDSRGYYAPGKRIPGSSPDDRV